MTPPDSVGSPAATGQTGDLRLRGVLEEAPLAPRAHRPPDVPIVVERGEDDDLRRAQQDPQPLGGDQPVQPGTPWINRPMFLFTARRAEGRWEAVGRQTHRTTVPHVHNVSSTSPR